MKLPGIVVGMLSASLLYVVLLLPMWGSAFRMTSSLTELNFLFEESLEVECSHSPEDTELVSVEQIRVVKQDGRRSWKVMAKIVASGSVVQSGQAFQVSGQVGPEANSTYLKLVWPTASEAEIGAYRCDVVGMDARNEFVVEKTNVVSVHEHNVTNADLIISSQRQLDSLQLEFDQYKTEAGRQMASLSKAVQELKNRTIPDSQVGNQTDSDSADPGLDIDQLREEILDTVLAAVSLHVENATCSRVSRCLSDLPQDSRTPGDARLLAPAVTSPVVTTPVHVTSPVVTTPGSVTTPVVTTPGPVTTPVVTTPGSVTSPVITTPDPVTTPALVKTTKTLLLWPSGRYGLLKPEAGCPESDLSPEWLSGYIGFHTESVDQNHDSTSPSIHMKTPVLSNYSYDGLKTHLVYMHFCINTNSFPNSPAWPAGSYCIHRVYGNCPSGFDSGYLEIDEEDETHSGEEFGHLPDKFYFCCRSDGDPSQAVTLPRDSPFYLYRFGGQCQAVEGMTVSGENITLDTENDDNADEYENDFHPDGQLEDIVLELCYYS